MKNVIVILFLLLPIVSFSQKEAAIWYFGQYAGLDFNSGSPVVLTDGQIDAFEGCATISDTNGNLLFYTDGVRVWDSSHTIMPNGNGLLGNTSSTQSAIIVPKPNNLDQYYIFTVDDNPSGGSSNGINYSTVDMTLNGGLGDVVTSEKNIALIANAFENITAINHSNNNSYWVITFIRDTFYAWLIDASGVNTTPVTSAASNTSSAIGYLKISPNGTKLASANYGSAPSIMLYDFDASNGNVSNEMQLNLDETDDTPYGVEFSLQNSKLYVETDKLTITGRTTPSKIIQYDLGSADIPNSGVVIHTSNTNTRGALQLAIDGKIYRAQSVSLGFTQAGTQYLGVINNPDALGAACNYVHDAIDISNGDAFRNVVEGLPPFIQSFFLEPTISATEVCLGEPTQFSLNSSTPPTSVSWDFGDPTTGADNTSSIENPTHIFSSSGIFNVTATVDVGGTIYNLTLDITIYELPVVTSPVTLIQCDDDLDGIVDFNLNEANTLITSETPAPTITYFLTENDALNNLNEITNTTTFSNGTAATVWARIENATHCISSAEVQLQVINTQIPADLMLNYSECDDNFGTETDGIAQFDFSSATNDVLNALLPATNLSVTYYETIPDALAETNAIVPNNYINSGSPFTQQIVVRVDDMSNDCFGLGYHVTLNVNPIPEYDLPSSITLCLGSNQTIGIENPADTYNYEWVNEANAIVGTTPEIEITTEGIYTVTATDTNGNNCTTSKAIEVINQPTGTLLGFDASNILVEDNSTNNTITVITSNLPAGNYEFALDSGEFQSNNVFENVSGGLHYVHIRDTENCLEATERVSLISIPNFFTPNNDGSNDYWQVTGVEFQPTSNIYIFDRFGKLLKKLNPLGPGWNGFYKGNPLPSTDYWYRVELEDGRVLKGHFSLIRRD